MQSSLSISATGVRNPGLRRHSWLSSRNFWDAIMCTIASHKIIGVCSNRRNQLHPSAVRCFTLYSLRLGLMMWCSNSIDYFDSASTVLGRRDTRCNAQVAPILVAISPSGDDGAFGKPPLLSFSLRRVDRLHISGHWFASSGRAAP